MSAEDVQRREARLIILRFLGEEVNRRLTSTTLTIRLDEMFLMDKPRVWVEQELDYLGVDGRGEAARGRHGQDRPVDRPWRTPSELCDRHSRCAPAV